MICSIFLIVLSLASISFGCTVQTVSDATTKDTPAFVSGSVDTNDILRIEFNYATYGGETGVTYSATTGAVDPTPTSNWARYIDSANTGFVKVTNTLGPLCPSHTLASQIFAASGAIAGIITYNSNCKDVIDVAVDWVTVKSDCGDQYFVSSTGTNTYLVNFVYRITYVELLPSGDSRTVSNDYSFQLSSPTQFQLDTATFQLADVATQVSSQLVQVDTSGQVLLTVQAIAICDATLTAVTVVDPGTFTIGTPTITTKGSQYTSGKFAGLCPYSWTVTVAAGSGCTLTGSFTVTYGITPTSSSAFTSPDVSLF